MTADDNPSRGMRHGPCERLIVSEGGIAELVRWQATQNGSLMRQGAQVERVCLDLVGLRGDFRAMADDIATLTEDIRWTRRLMLATVVTTVGSIVARSVGLL